MFKFLFKLSFFVLPIVISYSWCYFVFYVDGEDLQRMGYLPTKFLCKTNSKLYLDSDTIVLYDNFYEDRLDTSYDILVLGDSFSEGTNSFTNELAKKYKVLYFDNRINQNPIQLLTNLLNIGFFDSVKVKFIILESVERYVTERAVSCNENSKDSTILEKNITKKYIYPKKRFFSTQHFLFAFNSLKYFVFDNATFNNQVCKFQLNNNYFTNCLDNSLLVTMEDLMSVEYNNTNHLNRFKNIIQGLNKKIIFNNMKLILLVCPDKYDLYFDQIINNKKLKKPVFFNFLDSLNSWVTIVKSKIILKNKVLKKEKDLYYYDDTHWTKKSVKIISKNMDSIFISLDTSFSKKKKRYKIDSNFFGVK
jgi:hypothetical protein